MNENFNLIHMANLYNVVLYDEIFSSSSSSSSSSSEDDWYEDVWVQLGRVNCRCWYRRRRPRVQRYIETVVAQFNEVDFQQTFRYVIVVDFLLPHPKKLCVILINFHDLADCEELILSTCLGFLHPICKGLLQNLGMSPFHQKNNYWLLYGILRLQTATGMHKSYFKLRNFVNHW